MSVNVVTASLKTTHREAVALLREHNIRRLPVVDGDQLLGIVVQKDLLAAQPSAATSLNIYEIYDLLDKLTLQRIMKSPVLTVESECPIEEAARIMLDHKIGCLPVMRLGKMIGMITETDIFRVLVEVLGGGEQGIHFTVQVPDQPGKLAELCSAVAKAGGNIVGITSFASESSAFRDISVKEQGADQARLRILLREIEAEIIDIQSGDPYLPTLYGEHR